MIDSMIVVIFCSVVCLFMFFMVFSVFMEFNFIFSFFRAWIGHDTRPKEFYSTQALACHKLVLYLF